MTTAELVIVDVDCYLRNPDSDEAKEECKKAVEAIKRHGALIVRDPRVTEDTNDRFLDIQEQYFSQSTEIKMKDVRKEYGFQIGTTPELQEDPRCKRDPGCINFMEQMPEGARPHKIEGPDPKWRFFWRIGESPVSTKYPRFDAAQIIPEGFPDWAKKMDDWGQLMYQAVNALSEMLAIGFGLPKDTFTQLTKYGPHLLAPTGSDLSKYKEVGTVLAGFHYDLNFLTIHGKSRYPGLHIWPRNENQKSAVSIPDGCLLVQAGKQLEWITGGEVLAGYHEVVVTEATIRALQKNAAREVPRPAWRISSTFFLHVASDNTMKPNDKFISGKSAEVLKKYPTILAGEFVRNELSEINLME